VYRKDGHRAPASCKSKRAFLVIVRSELEAQYIHFIRRSLGQPVQIEQVSPDMAPTDMIAHARRLDRAAKGSGGNPADEIWCFINAHEQGGLPDRLPPKVRLALSAPGFPVWLLMHFSGLRTIESTEDAFEKLSDHLPALGSQVNEDTFAPLIGRYRQARATAIASRDGGTAAISTVYEFVDSLQESIRDYRGPEATLPVL
jgi:hypothetical protein